MGDGEMVNIWKDRWLPEGKEGRVRTVEPSEGGVQKVSELIKDGEWDQRLLGDVAEIRTIPVSKTGRKDRLY